MIRSQKLRDSANGQNCTLNIAGACNYNPETVVLCHFPHESHGTALKSTDISSGYGCSGCHDAIDNRSKSGLSEEDREFYMRRSQVRTWEKFVELGLVTVKGVK